MKTMLKDALVLFIITVVAGLALGFVYYITKEPIRLAEEKKANEAYAEVIPGASSFEELEVVSTTYGDFGNEWKSNGYDKDDIDKVLEAKDASGNSLGYVILVTTHAGFGGDISFTMGINSEGVLNGISILSISETPGLGMKAEEVLKPQYAGKNVTGFSVTKTGASADSQIDAISGATITSNALTTGVNSGLFYYQTNLGGV